MFGARPNIKQLLSIFRPAPTPEQDLSPSITTSNDPSFSRWTWKQVYCTNALLVWGYVTFLLHTHTHTHTRWGPFFLGRKKKKLQRKQEIGVRCRKKTHVMGKTVENREWYLAGCCAFVSLCFSRYGGLDGEKFLFEPDLGTARPKRLLDLIVYD